MEVYVDVLLAINFAVDFILLRITALLCAKNARPRRLALAAAVGAGGSLIIFLPPQSGFIMLCYRAALSLLMCAAAFYPCRKAAFIKSVLCLFTAGMLVSGALLLWQLWFMSSRVLLYAGAVYLDIGAPALLFCCVAGYAAAWLLSRMISGGAMRLRLCTVTVCHNGAVSAFIGLVDTGSSLREPFSGAPVIVCELSALGKTAPPELKGFSFESAAPKGLRLIPYRTLDSTGLLPAFLPDELLLETDGKTTSAKGCYIAAINASLSESYRAVCNPQAFLQNEKSGESFYENDAKQNI